MDAEHDADGRTMVDHDEGRDAWEIIERDDGWFGTARGTYLYVEPYSAWPDRLQTTVDRADGRVLDVGCGAGRAIPTSRRRGPTSSASTSRRAPSRCVAGAASRPGNSTWPRPTAGTAVSTPLPTGRHPVVRLPDGESRGAAVGRRRHPVDPNGGPRRRGRRRHRT
jgi:SAM-dependent methyltransferase